MSLVMLIFKILSFGKTCRLVESDGIDGSKLYQF
jgi:hypothetical protein